MMSYESNPRLNHIFLKQLKKEIIVYLSIKTLVAVKDIRYFEKLEF